MPWIAQVIFFIDVINVNIIIVTPILWPRFGVCEPITGVLETSILPEGNVEPVFAPKIGAEAVFRYATTATAVNFALCMLSMLMRFILPSTSGRCLSCCSWLWYC
jgi:hypothetical protein